jgi:hypothetical protein
MRDLMSWAGNFEGLERYLRDFTNIGGDPAYDTNGILILLLALADNLRRNASPEEMQELTETLSPEQSEFLSQLATWAREGHCYSRPSEHLTGPPPLEH